jgi:hypothetical protein
MGYTRVRCTVSLGLLMTDTTHMKSLKPLLLLRLFSPIFSILSPLILSFDSLDSLSFDSYRKEAKQ